MQGVFKVYLDISAIYSYDFFILINILWMRKLLILLTSYSAQINLAFI